MRAVFPVDFHSFSAPWFSSCQTTTMWRILVECEKIMLGQLSKLVKCERHARLTFQTGKCEENTVGELTLQVHRWWGQNSLLTWKLPIYFISKMKICNNERSTCCADLLLEQLQSEERLWGQLPQCVKCERNMLGWLFKEISGWEHGVLNLHYIDGEVSNLCWFG